MCQDNAACGAVHHHGGGTPFNQALMLLSNGAGATELARGLIGFTGSYRREDCVFLLEELHKAYVPNHVLATEDPAKIREHLACWEEEPSAATEALYQQAMQHNAGRLAGDTVALARGITARAQGKDEIVLVSIARGGTPIGVLLVRALRLLGAKAVHYSVSTAPSHGIDLVALNFIREHHREADVWFVDGWASKDSGAVRRLNTSISRFRSDERGKLVCISDLPGVSLASATTDDYLIPSAVLDAPANGLVSRTYASGGDIVVGAPPFHGAFIYKHLNDVDRSNDFVDRIGALFPGIIAGTNSAEAPALAGRSEFGLVRTRSVRLDKRLAAQYGVSGDMITHGYNATVRAIQRGPLQSLLLRDPSTTANSGILLLAKEQNIEVVHDADLTLECAGIRAEAPFD